MTGVSLCQLPLLNQSLNLSGLPGNIRDSMYRGSCLVQRAVILTRDCAVEACFVSGSTS